MPYPPTKWTNDIAPRLNQANLNKMETGIQDATALGESAAVNTDARLSDARTPIDASVTALKMAAENKGVIICESTTRPASPVKGQHIYEIDTEATLKNNGTPAAPVWTTVGAGAGGAVAADAPLAGDGTTTNHLRMPAATASAPGHMTAVDKAKLNTWVTVMDYGAVGDGVTDDTVAFQAALNASLFVFVPRPSAFYNIVGTLKLHDFTIMSGPGLYGNSDGNQPTGGAKIVFTGTAAACIVAADPTTPLVHGGMANMVLRDTGSYSNMFDVPTLAGWKMTSMRMETTSLSANLFRSRKIDPAQPSWVVNWWDVEFRLPDTSTGRTIDVDFSDAAIVAGSSSGGKGAIFRGAGGVKLIGGRYDRSSGSGITLSIEHESKSPYIIEGCEIEENSVNGILLDADALDTRVETWVMPVINGCYFRNHVAGAADIRFKNDTGSIIRGGVVGSNSHVSTAVPIARDPMRWQDVTILPGTVYTKSGHNSYAGGRYLQSPLVLGQSGGMATLTGTTVETVLATIEVPADSMLANGRLRVVTLWNTSSSAGAKNLRIKFGGTVFRNVAVSGTSQVAAQLMADIQNRNNTAAQVATGGNSNGGAEVSGGILVGAINTRVANNIEIVGQLAATTDTINLQAYLVELIPAQ